jgi:hypothetical protein
MLHFHLSDVWNEGFMTRPDLANTSFAGAGWNAYDATPQGMYLIAFVLCVDGLAAELMGSLCSLLFSSGFSCFFASVACTHSANSILQS